MTKRELEKRQIKAFKTATKIYYKACDKAKQEYENGLAKLTNQEGRK